MTGILLIMILLLLLSAYFSASEIAFVISNKLKIEVRARKNNLAAKNALYFVKNPQVFFITILISNTVVNITFATVITIFLGSEFHSKDWQILLISTAIILVLGELIPKYLARELPDSFILASVLPLRAISILLFPLVGLLRYITKIFTFSESLSKEEEVNIFDKDAMKHLITESSEAGKVKEADSDVLNKIIELKEQKVYEAITPRTAISGVDINSTLEEALTIFVETGYSKIIVYDENLDNVKGFIIAYDMFKNPESLKSILRDIIFVPETKKSLDMLNEFLSKHISIAIVVDEFGGTAGLVTVEDIIEEMFGEIRDEYDTEEEICRKLSTDSFLSPGKMEIDHLNEEFEMGIPSGDYETLGGFITANLGRIPLKGETVKIGKFSFTIIRSEKTRINLVKIVISQE